MAYRQFIAGSLEGDLFEGAQVGVGDGADGAEEFAVVLGEVRSGGVSSSTSRRSWTGVVDRSR
jgi:hypothetical protein